MKTEYGRSEIPIKKINIKNTYEIKKAEPMSSSSRAVRSIKNRLKAEILFSVVKSMILWGIHFLFILYYVENPHTSKNEEFPTLDLILFSGVLIQPFLFHQ